MVLVKAKLPDASRFPVQQKQVGHMVATVDTRYPSVSRRGTQHNPAVGQVAGVIVIDIGIRIGGNLLKAGSIHPNLINMPAAFRVQGRKQQAVALPMKA
ncbi:MAG: hypothetical protein BWY09_01543 [Candidatus Hydrogenedentes bacterium ADurb.Bin179]|nr:MAG: hypothetical protein BWY09_01543 [Candidatus Hydrogenedentes bacterium ADurb.Bin179]